MFIQNISEILFQAEGDLKELLRYNFESEIINEIYFKPKKVDRKLINIKLNDDRYLEKVRNTINYFKDKDIEEIVKKKLNNYEIDTGYKIEHAKIYLIIGLDTTTIYATRYKDEDITVLLLEATNGLEDKLDILLAHEYTHFIRKQIYKRDIFEQSIGERFIVEGIGCNYSREIVPNKEIYEYCLVDQKVVKWVKENIPLIENHMQGQVHDNSLMYDYFYMFADFEKTGIKPRSGYVYGYLKVLKYLQDNNLKIKDILASDYKEILEKQKN